MVFLRWSEFAWEKKFAGKFNFSGLFRLYHVAMLEYTEQFEQRFWMSQQMFYDLVDKLRVPLTVLYIKLMGYTSGNNPIYPEVILPLTCGF